MKTPKNWFAGIVAWISLLIVATALCVALVAILRLVVWLLGS